MQIINELQRFFLGRHIQGNNDFVGGFLCHSEPFLVMSSAVETPSLFWLQRIITETARDSSTSVGMTK
jgi:hypothetical protein